MRKGLVAKNTIGKDFPKTSWHFRPTFESSPKLSLGFGATFDTRNLAPVRMAFFLQTLELSGVDSISLEEN